MSFKGLIGLRSSKGVTKKSFYFKNVTITRYDHNFRNTTIPLDVHSIEYLNISLFDVRENKPNLSVRREKNSSHHLPNFNVIMTSGGLLSIGEINALELEEFEWLFGNVVEDYPEAARHVGTKRPFRSAEALKNAFDEFLDTLETSEQEEVLNHHPDLAGKLADEGNLTPESKSEQQIAGLETLTKGEKQILIDNNYLYREKFKFPFVICARENKVSSIIHGLKYRLKNSRTAELINGMQEVKKICRLRVTELVWPDV